jgi:D-aspartate ligase
MSTSTTVEPDGGNRRHAVPVLILGRGLTALGAVRCLGRRGVPLYVTGGRVGAITRSRWYRTLPEEGPNEFSEEDLGSRLESLTIRRMVLLPCSDTWAMAVSRLKPELATRFPSSVAPPGTLRQLVDKAIFSETLARFGLPHPRTVVLRDAGALEEIPANRLQDYFLKPNQSVAFAALYGAKALRFRDRADALRLLQDASAKGLTMMLQEFIPGPPTRHVFVEGFMDRRGRICGLLARRRMRMFPEEFGNSTCCVTIPLVEVSGAVETITRLLAGIGYRGVFSAEFKLDERDGLFKILEVNARSWWYVDFAARCGVDVCRMAYWDALGSEIEPVTTYQVGRRCIYPHLDLQSRLGENGKRALSGWSLLRSWLGAYQPTFSWEDPVPGIVDFFSLIREQGWRRFGR